MDIRSSAGKKAGTIKKGMKDNKEDESVFRLYPATTEHGQKLDVRSGKAEKPIHSGTPCRDYWRRI